MTPNQLLAAPCPPMPRSRSYESRHAISEPMRAASFTQPSTASPSSAGDDQCDVALRDAEVTCERAVAHPTGCVAISDLTDLIASETRPMVPFAVHSSPLCDHVGGVFGACAEKPVIGILARRVVAGVAYLEPGRNRADTHLEAEAVCADDSSLDAELAVAPPIRCAQPWPTFVRPALVREVDVTPLGRPAVSSPQHRSRLVERAMLAPPLVMGIAPTSLPPRTRASGDSAALRGGSLALQSEGLL